MPIGVLSSYRLWYRSFKNSYKKTKNKGKQVIK